MNHNLETTVRKAVRHSRAAGPAQPSPARGKRPRRWLLLECAGWLAHHPSPEVRWRLASPRPRKETANAV